MGLYCRCVVCAWCVFVCGVGCIVYIVGVFGVWYELCCDVWYSVWFVSSVHVVCVCGVGMWCGHVLRGGVGVWCGCMV